MPKTMLTAEDPIVANRRARLRAWIDAHFGGSHTLFIASTNDGKKQLNQGELSALLKSKTFGERRARSLELMAHMPLRYLDDMGEAPIATDKNRACETDTGMSRIVSDHAPTALRPPAPTGWPFHRVTLARIVNLKKQLGAKTGAAALDDVDETLDLVVSKWERRAASRAKSNA